MWEGWAKVMERVEANRKVPELLINYNVMTVYPVTQFMNSDWQCELWWCNIGEGDTVNLFGNSLQTRNAKPLRRTQNDEVATDVDLPALEN